MKKKLSARELEISAAAIAPPKRRAVPLTTNEALAMLARRGLRPSNISQDVFFPLKLAEKASEQFLGQLDHYAFRIFLRGAIQKSGSFLPEETTRYLTAAQSKEYVKFLVDLGLAERTSGGRYRLTWPVQSFGGMLEWYVAHELERRFGFQVATGVKLHARGVGGDLDVVAAAEGKLVYLELKSSPPKNLTTSEIIAFFDRVFLLRPDLTLFVVDTALRLTDKVLPMLMEELMKRRYKDGITPQRITPQLWMLTPHLYVVNGRRDLMANIGRAIGAGFLALSVPL